MRASRAVEKWGAGADGTSEKSINAQNDDSGITLVKKLIGSGVLVWTALHLNSVLPKVSSTDMT
jgi:hypothetical protein